MNTKWLLNKVAALVIAATILIAFARYYNLYNFNITHENNLLFWAPLAVVGIISIAVYVWTFKAKKEDK